MMMRMIMAIRACKLIAPYISFAGIIWILLVDKLDNPPRRRSLLHVSHLPHPPPPDKDVQDWRRGRRRGTFNRGEARSHTAPVKEALLGCPWARHTCAPAPDPFTHTFLAAEGGKKEHFPEEGINEASRYTWCALLLLLVMLMVVVPFLSPPPLSSSWLLPPSMRAARAGRTHGTAKALPSCLSFILYPPK